MEQITNLPRVYVLMC